MKYKRNCAEYVNLQLTAQCCTFWNHGSLILNPLHSFAYCIIINYVPNLAFWLAGTNIRQHQVAERHCTVHSSNESQIVVLFYGFVQQLEITRQSAKCDPAITVWSIHKSDTRCLSLLKFSQLCDTKSLPPLQPAVWPKWC